MPDLIIFNHAKHSIPLRFLSYMIRQDGGNFWSHVYNSAYDLHFVCNPTAYGWSRESI